MAAITAVSINISANAGTDVYDFEVLVNPTIATGGSALPDGATSNGGLVTGLQKAVEAARNTIKTNGHI